MSCVAAFSRVHGYCQNPSPPQCEEAELEMPGLPTNHPIRPEILLARLERSEIPSVFYKSGAENVPENFQETGGF